MPNRIPTPPPPMEESKFLAVIHPYPLNANLELLADRCALALWLACCAGKDVLRAMFYKHSSPEMVVIEVDPEFDRFHKLLGLHLWSEFLMEPNKGQMDKSSTVLYSTFDTSRLVNTGWKRVNIEEHWFQEWATKNSTIRYPYPKSGHCKIPSSSEAKSGAPVCRLLPQCSLTVPPPVAPSNEEDQPKYSTVASMSDFNDSDFDNWNPPPNPAAPAGGPTRAGGAVNRYNVPWLEAPTKMKGEWTSPQHGSLCSPGICKERTRVKRDKRMRVAREKWEEERRQREAQRARGQVKRERKQSEAMGEGKSEWRSHPPRLCRSTSSGTSPNTSSNSGSESDSDESRKQSAIFP